MSGKNNNDKPDVMLMAAKEGSNMYHTIRNMKKCSSKCPMFDTCPLAPISIKPKDYRERVCLVNAGSHDVRRAYINMFLRGHSGLVDEIMRAYAAYLASVEEYEKDMHDGKGNLKVLTPKDRERLVMHRERVLNATLSVHKTFYGDGYQSKKKPKEEPIRIVESNSPGDMEEEGAGGKKKKRPVITKRNAEILQEAEYKIMEEVKPDPESLVYSERLKEEVLPSMVVVDPAECPPGTPEVPAKFQDPKKPSTPVGEFFE